MQESFETYLPVENKNHAVRMVVIINLIIITGITFLLMKFFSLALFSTFLLIILIDVLLAWLTLTRQSIQKVKLGNQGLQVIYKAKTIDISFNDIKSIDYALNDYIDYNGKLSLLYTLRLKSKYGFGHNLYFKYPIKNRLDNEPEEIIRIRKRLKKANNQEYKLSKKC